MTTTEIKKGDRVRLTFCDKRETRVFTARVNWTEELEGGIYFGYTPDSIENGAWGCATLRPEPKPFGLQNVEVL